MFCTKCGTSLQDNSVFCLKCGANLSAAGMTASQAGATQNPESNYDKSTPSHKKKLPLWSIIITMILNLPLGVVANICKNRSVTGYSMGDTAVGNYYAKASLISVIIGGLLGIISILILILVIC